MRTIKEKMNEERIKSVALSKLATEKCTSFDRAMELRKKRNECYNKFVFLKNLNKALEENNDSK